MNSTPQFYEYVRSVRTDDISAAVSFHEDDERWHVTALVRAKGGLYHFTATYGGDQPGVTRLIRHARDHGRFSLRPVRIRQYFDPSMKHGALELLRCWCERNDVDALSLINQGYQGAEPLTLDDIAEITTQAKWEGIVYPRQWTRTVCHELATALFEVGCVQLAALFLKVLESRRR